MSLPEADEPSSSHPTGIIPMRGFPAAAFPRAHAADTSTDADGPVDEADDATDPAGDEAAPAPDAGQPSLIATPALAAPRSRERDTVIVRHPLADIELKVLEVVVNDTTLILLFEKHDKVSLNPKIGAKFAISYKGVDYGVCAVHELASFRTQPCQACIFVRVVLDDASHEDGQGGTG